VVLTCNPSNSGDRDQEDSFRDPISKKPITKIGLVEWLKVKTLSSNPSTAAKKKKKKKKDVT
jgi:hypothetical protein